MSDVHDLHRVDLNLMVAFDTLVRERSVTAAAKQVGVTQSAMSHTLKRLRDLFGDPLLVRGRGGMVLTPHAQALVAPLRTGLLTLSRAMAAPQAFDPATARRTFRIAAPGLFDGLALPILLRRCRDEAPGVDLTVVPLDERFGPEQLENGEIDMTVLPRSLEQGDGDFHELSLAGLVQRVLLRDTFSCFIRAGHPALTGASGRRRLSLPRYVKLPHAIVSPRGRGTGLVDRVLADRGMERRIALRIPDFHLAPPIIAETDLVLTAPSALAQALGEDPRLCVLPPPLPLPGHALALVWHQRFNAEPGHEWLRGVIAEVGKVLARNLPRRRRERSARAQG